MFISQQKIQSILLFLFSLHIVSFLHGQGGCDPLTLQTTDKTLTYRGATNATGTYSLLAKVITNSTDRSFDLEIRNLRRSNDQQQVDTKLLQLGSNQLLIKAGSGQLVIPLKSPNTSGSYSGELVLINKSGACPIQEIAFSVEILDPSAIRIEFIADDPSTNLILSSWGNGWWPEQFNRDGIPFFIHNDGKVPVTLDGINLLAMGKQSGEVLAVPNTYSGQIIGPGQKIPIKLLVDDSLFCLADSYIGDLNVSMNGLQQPITASVTTNIKEGTFKALIWLIIGFFAAYLFYLRDRFSGRLEIIGQLKNIRILIAEVENGDAKNGLLAASRKIERDLQFKNTEAIKAEVQLLREKTMGIIEAEETANEFSNQFPDKEDQIESVFKRIYQLFLRGDMEKAKVELQNLKDKWSETIATERIPIPTGSRSIQTDHSDLTLESIIVDKGDVPAPPQKEVSQPWYQYLERYIIAFRRWWEWFINWWLVPITQLVAFLLVIYTGLNAVYVEDLTFGVNGMLDYIKLFLYAMVTNVFSEEVFVKRARAIVTKQSEEAGSTTVAAE